MVIIVEGRQGGDTESQGISRSNFINPFRGMFVKKSQL